MSVSEILCRQLRSLEQTSRCPGDLPPQALDASVPVGDPPRFKTRPKHAL